MHLASLVGILPGMSAMATAIMTKTMDKLEILPVPEFIEMVADAGCKLSAGKATVDMFKLKKEDFGPQVDSIIIGFSDPGRPRPAYLFMAHVDVVRGKINRLHSYPSNRYVRTSRSLTTR